MRSFSAMLPSKSILVADVGQNQIWSANNFKTKNGVFLTSGAPGHHGLFHPRRAGGQARKAGADGRRRVRRQLFPDEHVRAGDHRQNQIDVKLIVMRNTRLGMVRELQDKLYGGRYAATLLDVNFDLLKIAEAYGIPAKMVHSTRRPKRKPAGSSTGQAGVAAVRRQPAQSVHLEKGERQDEIHPFGSGGEPRGRAVQGVRPVFQAGFQHRQPRGGRHRGPKDFHMTIVVDGDEVHR